MTRSNSPAKPIAAWLAAPDARAGGIAAVAAALVFAALFSNLLRFHAYPMLRPEVGLAAVILVGASLVYGVAYRLSGRIVRALLETALILFAVNVNTTKALILVPVGVVALSYLLARRATLLPVLATMALVAGIAGAVGFGQQHDVAMETKRGPVSPAADARLPIIVHLILDEHIGIEGLPPRNPNTPAMRAALTGFYASRGFRLFGLAHSDHYSTINSIPEILNFGESQKLGASVADKKHVARLAYFDALARKGYRIDVIQSDYLDYCRHPAVERCTTYSSQNFAAVAAADLSTSDKAGLLLQKFDAPLIVKLGRAGYNGLRALGAPLPYRELATRAHVTPLNALGAFDTLIRELGQAKSGHVYFAHILLPHHPYALDPDCGVKPVERWLRRHTLVSMAARQDAAFDQMRCALAKLDQAYAAVDRASAGRPFIMVVHGDHGWRLVDRNPAAEHAGTISRDDMIAGFSTLFAVHAPGIATGYDRARLSPAMLLRSLAASGFRDATTGGEVTTPTIVNLADRKYVPRVRAALPQPW